MGEKGLSVTFRDGWMSRGRELNAIYDALTVAVGHSPNGDPVEDIRALGGEVRRLREAIREHHAAITVEGPVRVLDYESAERAMRKHRIDERLWEHMHV